MNNQSKRILIFLNLIIILFGCIRLNAQEVSVYTKADTNNVMIGDQIKIQLVANLPRNYNLILPQIPDSIGKFELVRKGKIDTFLTEKNMTIKMNLIVTSFDSGLVVFPSFTFMYYKPGFRDSYPASTNELSINFTVPNVDTSKEIKGIKDPLDVAWSWKDFIWYIIIAIALALVVFFGYKYWKNRPKNTKVENILEPKISYSMIALEGLRKLDEEKIWQKGKFKQYYTELSDILRVYIEKRFNIQAQEQTTDEILQSLHLKLNDKTQMTNLKNILELADLAKFAKYEPILNENTNALDNALIFVKSTMILENSKENTTKLDDAAQELAKEQN